MSARGEAARVVIVGGGIAGLATAETLARTHPDRFAITLLEAKRHPGGRAGSFHDAEAGETIDYCQHVAMGCCTHLLGLIERCGRSEAFRRYDSLQFFWPGAEPSTFKASRWLPPPLHLAGALQGLRFLDTRSKWEIARGVWALMRTPTDRLVDVTAGDWLRRHGQSEKGIERFWEVILVSALGERTELVSMAAARKVLIDGFAGARGASDVWVPRRPLSEIFGREIPESLRELGVEIRTETPVRRIAPPGDSSPEVETVRGETIHADHVVVAVPWHALRRLLENSRLPDPFPRGEEVTAFPSSPITGVHLWFDREITGHPHAVLVGTLAQWVFRDDARGGGRPSEAERVEPQSNGSEPPAFYYQVVISGSHPSGRLGRTEITSQVIDDLRLFFPAAREAKVLRTRVVSDPHAVFTVSPHVERLRPDAATNFPWLHLAGDWIQTGWPATMEGAVISGRMAAAGICRRLELPEPQIDPGLRRGWWSRRLIT